MDTVTIIVNTPPYGDERIWNALRLAKALVSGATKTKINVFLLGDAVSAAKKGQKTPEGYYNLEKMLKELVEKGVEVNVCGTCINSRVIAESELVEGIHVGTMMSLTGWIKESQKVLSF
jgi:uncharacterized protein involved in oxidation of intracellular sulfur